MTDRIVVLLDMDCFYVQVEERDNPHIRGKPAAVVQYNTWKGGGLIATNYEARAKGVKKGSMRGDDARAICPDMQLIQVPVKRGKADLTKYRLAGKEVISVLCEFSECVERASIDEAYIDFTEAVETRLKVLAGKHVTSDLLKGSWVVGYDQEEGEEARKNGIQEWLHNIYNSGSECESEEPFSSTNHTINASHPNKDKLRLTVAAVLCEEMRAEVLARTGFKCSAGISHNKMLGKLACGLHKPNQQTLLPMENVPQLWEKLPVHKIRNLGGKLGESLVDEIGCRYMGDLSHLSLAQLRGRYDDKTALWLHGLGRGICTEAVIARQLPKSIGCGKNFLGKESLNTKEKVQQWMRSLCDELSERLEEDKETNKRRAKTIHVSIRLDNDIGGFSKQCPLPSYVPERICSLAISLIQHTNTAQDQRWVPCIKNISLSAGKFEDSTGSRSANIQDMFKKAASLASTQRCNFIKSSQFVEDLSSSISTTLDEKKVDKSKMGPLQSMLEKQLLLQESFITTPEKTVKDFGNECSKTDLVSENYNTTKAMLENPTKEEKPKTTKSFFKQFMMKKQLEQNTNTSNEICNMSKEDCSTQANFTEKFCKPENDIEKNNKVQYNEVVGEESEDELDLLVSQLEDESSSEKSDSDAAYDAPTDIDSSFNSNRTNSQHNDTVNNSKPKCYSQDLFSDDDSPSNVQRQSHDNAVEPESSYLKRGKDLLYSSVNKNVVSNSPSSYSNQDFFSDESSNDVWVRDENNSVESESTYSRKGEDLEKNDLNKNIANTKVHNDKDNQLLGREIDCNVQLEKKSENTSMTKPSNKDNEEKLKISVSELFPDLDSIDETILPMLPAELRTAVEMALHQHRAKDTSDNLMKKTGIWKYVSKSPTKQDSNPSTSIFEGNNRYELEPSKSAATTVLNDPGHFVSKNDLPNGLSNDLSKNTENMNKNSKSSLIQGSEENKCEEDMITCDECGAQVWVFDLPEHQDFHLAVKIQKDFRNQHLTSSTSAKAESSPLKSGSGSKNKKRSNQSKGETFKHQKLDLFFRPK